MKLTRNQLDSISKYLGDISKLVFAATVLGFFVPIGPHVVTLQEFIGGVVSTTVLLGTSVKLAE